MINLEYLRKRIFDHIVKFILAEKNDALAYKAQIYRNFTIFSSILLITFTIGMIVSAMTSYLMAGLVDATNKETITTHNFYVNKNKSASYSMLKKNMVTRNIFNVTGEIPYEDTAAGNEKFLLRNFENAPCAINEKLPVELIGVIYTGNTKTSLVMLNNTTTSAVDVYQEGQSIIDYDDYSLFKVTGPSSAVFRHVNMKICVSLDQPGYNNEQTSTPTEDNANISLSSAFVTQQLGPGFSSILNSARLVPQIIDGKTQGFKIFAIAKDSLFDKIQLENGDVIKSVNRINLEDPSKGFKVYEAFQDENNITLQIDRNGVILTKKVTVQ